MRATLTPYAVVVGLFVYMLLSRAGPVGHFELLFTPAAMITAQAVLAAIDEVPFVITDIKRRERLKNPPAPFTTSPRQPEAAKRLGFTAQRTMRTAQPLCGGGYPPVNHRHAPQSTNRRDALAGQREGCAGSMVRR